MIHLLLLLALAQDAELEPLVEQLNSDQAAVREKATAELVERGPSIVPRILSLYRSSTSPEVQLRAQSILLRFPFQAFARTRRKEPLFGTLKETLLSGLVKHRETPGCWRPQANWPTIDPAQLRILWQSGSGHGQYLAIDQIMSVEGSALVARRIAFQGTTPYRPQVKAEGVRVQESRWDREEAAALVELLQEGASLESLCAIEPEAGHSWMSTGSFSMRFKIESRGAEIWSAAYTGYPGSQHQREYSHGEILDNVLRQALSNRSWTDSKVAPEDRARALQWMTDHFASEGWWVKEHYLNIARFIGDETYAPFLKKVVNSLEKRDGPSEKRQLQSARDALSRLERSEK